MWKRKKIDASFERASIRIFRQIKSRNRAIETLKAVSSIKNDLNEKTQVLDRYVEGKVIVPSIMLMKQEYNKVHKDILGKKNSDKIKEAILYYNNCIMGADVFGARNAAESLMSELDNLTERCMVEFGIAEWEIGAE